MTSVLMAMSGGVDSSVAAALLVREGHHVVGVTMRLWGGDSDTGCCSVSDVDDARRSADHLDIEHLVFNFSDDFDEHVVEPYVADHAAGITPNPCIECNRRVKFARLAERADVLGFDAVATGHHARIDIDGGRYRLRRGVDRAKDQSYVVHMLDQKALARTMFPIGDHVKTDVRALAADIGLRTATKPDSQDVCFITSTDGRREFLRRRIELTPARVVDRTGAQLGEVASLEMVTLGQRRGLGLPGGEPKRFVTAIDRATSTVVMGDAEDLLDHTIVGHHMTWVDGPVPAGTVLVQTSAHGTPAPAAVHVSSDGRCAELRWETPQRRVAPGQSVVLYDRTDDHVLGGGTAIAASVGAGRRQRAEVPEILEEA